MKNVMISLALVMGLGLTQINAQSVSGGIKADANISNFVLNDMDAFLSNLGFGVSLGGFARIGFGEHFALQPELLFHFKTSETENETTNGKIDYQYFGVEIPVYVLGQMDIGSGKGYIGIGPYVGFGFDARYKADSMDDLELYKEYSGNKSAMQRWDFGAGATLGYEFANRISINAGYKIGFVDALNANKDNATMLPQTVSLGLGYTF